MLCFRLGLGKKRFCFVERSLVYISATGAHATTRFCLALVIAVLPSGEFVIHTTPPKRGRKRKNFDETPPSQMTSDLAKRRSTRVCLYDYY